MVTRYSIAILALGITCTANAQVFRAQTDTQVEACGALLDETTGGGGTPTSQSRLNDRALCGDEAVVVASAYSDLASGYAFVAASAEGPAGTNRATATAQYTDLVRIESTQDTVTVRAALTLVANASGSTPGGSEFLFARITLGPAGEIELRGCNPVFCPDEPVITSSLGGEFTVQRNPASGLFPPIGVAATAIIDARSGGGFYSASTLLEVIDNSGAQLVSASGVYGTQVVEDADTDGAPDGFDTCTTVANSNQRDSDADGIGNACDPDLNNDLVVDVIDLGLMRQRFFGNDPDADLDGDGVVNIIDLGVLGAFFGQAPGGSE